MNKKKSFPIRFEASVWYTYYNNIRTLYYDGQRVSGVKLDKLQRILLYSKSPNRATKSINKRFFFCTFFYIVALFNDYAYVEPGRCGFVLYYSCFIILYDIKICISGVVYEC